MFDPDKLNEVVRPRSENAIRLANERKLKRQNDMTNEEKAKEIAYCCKCPYDRKKCKQTSDMWCHEYKIALEMAEWKDEQFKEYLEKKKTERK